MPELREPEWTQRIRAYLKSVESASTESAKSHRFTALLSELFRVQPDFIDQYVSGIEKYIKVREKDRILRGKVDNLFGNLVIEFERDLKRTRAEAEEQLKKYVACLWSQETPGHRMPYVCVACDGVNFAVYSPLIQNLETREVVPEEVTLSLLEQVDWLTLEPREVYYWLDRYFLRREKRLPKTEEVVKDFGVRSHAFQTTGERFQFLWKNLKGKPEFKVLYEGWEKYLRIVYGTEVAEDELFVKHTYLATLAKLMVWCRLAEGKTSPEDADILSVLGGGFFKEKGIENFIEEDFFSWVAREGANQQVIEIARMLLSLLANYDLRGLSEDVLKSLYQELVDPKTRHDLGEYYTPDWLAHRMVQKLIEQTPKGSFLDPASGSGTFLYFLIKEKRYVLGDSAKTLKHICNSVVGLDVHPLAVIIAKTNYILALGDLLKRRRTKVSIPIYLSNSIKLPEKWGRGQKSDYEIKVNGKMIYVPEKLLKSPGIYDDAIDASKEFATENAGKGITIDSFTNYLTAHHPQLSEDKEVIQELFRTTKTLKSLVESKRDTIWAFVIKNIYKPLFLRAKFDFVIGNPPWLSYRYVEQLEYQKFLKKQITDSKQGYGLLSGRGELITHMELGTLFFLRAADLYLKEGGAIAFVLPRSIFTADQHDALRQGNFTGVKLSFNEVWDLEEVKELFKVPCCVLFATKEATGKIAYPVAGQVLHGNLPRKNVSLNELEAGKEVTVKNVQFSLHLRGKRSFWSTEESVGEKEESHYKKHFYQGATIVPRSFWFVDVKASALGFDPALPPVESSERARKQAKDAYKDVHLTGNVESPFLYATLLSTDLLPFGHLDYRLVVLPIEPVADQYSLVHSDNARRRGFLHLAKWLEKVQGEWATRRGSKAKAMTSIGWLDYRRKLSSQSPSRRFRVIYPDVNRLMLAAVIDLESQIVLDFGGQQLAVQHFVVDYTNYFFETDQMDEASYLSAMLNSSVVDEALTPFRRRMQKGHPHVVKKVFDAVSLPRFSSPDRQHRTLARYGSLCSRKVAEWVESGGPGKIRSIGKLRSIVRQLLQDELKEIDRIVEKVLS